MKKNIHIGVGVLVLLLVLGFGAWFWSLGSVVPESAPPIQLRVSHGPVEVQRQGGTDWKTIDATTDVRQGDSIRTGSEGRAEIQWSDFGVSRIDPATELVVESAPADVNVRTGTSLHLKLVAGSVWTRLLKLLDVSSSAQVSNGNVVATVRGTAFGVGTSNQGMDVAVGDSVVSIGTTSTKDQTLVREGRWGHFSTTGTPEIVRDLHVEDVWAQDNIKKDVLFDTDSYGAFEGRLKQRVPSAPGWLVGGSERLRLALARGADADRLETAYARRRLAVVVLHPEQADRAMSELETFRGNREELLSDIRFALAGEHVSPDRRVRDALQDLRRRLLDKTPEGLRYAFALNIDDHIDDLVFPATPMTQDERLVLLNVLYTNIDDWEKGNDGSAGDLRRLLDLKGAAMRERLAGVGRLLNPSTDSTSSTTTTSTNPGDATSTISGVEVGDSSSFVPPASSSTPSDPEPTPTSTLPKPPVCQGERATMFVNPIEGIHVHDKVAMSLFLVCMDGKTQDVTSRATFTHGAPADGLVDGSIFIPDRDGKIYLIGTVTDNDQVFTATVMITVLKSPRRLIGVNVEAIGTTNLTTGQSAPVKGYALYSDGSKVDITFQCAWSTSDSRKAMISNQRFISLSGTGVIAAMCGYTDTGSAQSGKIDFTITTEPSVLQGSPPKPSGVHVPVKAG